MSTSPGHLPALDSLRGLAVLAVLTGHMDFYFFGQGFDLLPGGFIGVDLFFVLSGFLITRNLIGEFERSGGISLRRFYLRRALRLAPALVLLLLVLVPVLLLANTTEPQVLLKGVLAIVFYVFNWFTYLTLESIPGTGHLWSLSVEEQFYLIWPLLVLLVVKAPRWRGIALLACLLASVLVAALRARGWSAGDSWLLLYLRTDLRADALLLGAALAFGERAEPLAPGTMRGLRVTGLAFLGAFSVATLFLDGGAGYMYLGGFSAVAFGGSALVFACARGALGEGVKPLNSLGRVSYGIYLYHMPIVMALASPSAAETVPAEWPRLFAALFLTLAAAYLSFHLVEHRFLRLKRRL